MKVFRMEKTSNFKIYLTNYHLRLSPLSLVQLRRVTMLCFGEIKWFFVPIKKNIPQVKSQLILFLKLWQISGSRLL